MVQKYIRMVVEFVNKIDKNMAISDILYLYHHTFYLVFATQDVRITTVIKI